IVKGNAAFNGNLVLEIADGAEQFPLGVELTLLDLRGTVSGKFSSVSLPPTEAGTVWNTDSLLTTGKIKVVLETAILHPDEVSINVYPNPADDYLTVSGLSKGENIRIYDLYGRLNLNIQADSEQENIRTADLQEGVYVVEIKKDSAVQRFKIAVRH
ncbi:MAG: T9SS type A sorting domain-containing protein, partial [Dysgonamonadaceae bacterium]|nr:T9SS type A sorting domain-containing protein [Dysgonamonadaceae bacterium]